MLIKRYKSVLNKEYFDISEIGQEGFLEGLSRTDLLDLIDGLCGVLSDDELLKANTIVEANLFIRSADLMQKEVLNEVL